MTVSNTTTVLPQPKGLRADTPAVCTVLYIVIKEIVPPRLDQGLGRHSVLSSADHRLRPTKRP